MNYPPSHKKYLPPRKHWLERKGIMKIEPHEPLPLSGWFTYGVIYALILVPVYFFG